MPWSDRPLEGYLSAVAEEAEETRFLRSIPWVFDAGQPPVESLIKGLRLEASLLAEFPRRVRFSLIAVMQDASPLHLRELILSMRCQSQLDWELILVDRGSLRGDHLALARRWAARDSRIVLMSRPDLSCRVAALNLAIERATGEFVIPIDPDGMMHPAALGAFTRHLQKRPDANFLFANEAEIDPSSQLLSDFLLKPPLDLFTLLRSPYVGRPYAVGRALLDLVRGDAPAFRPAYEGVEEHDLLLRLALSDAIRPIHVPLFCYYGRKADPASPPRPHVPRGSAGLHQRMLSEFVPRAYPGASWRAIHPVPGSISSPSTAHIRLTYLKGRPRPKLLVVVPFKDDVETTLGCVRSIESQVHCLDVIVALTDNRSAEAETIPTLRRWIAKQTGIIRYELFHHDGAFNYARINNAAIAKFGGDCDLFLFLNNDVELTTPETLQTMAMQLVADRGAGFVGIKLYFPGGDKIQHGGVRLGETIWGSGYNQLLHSQTDNEFVHDDRVSFCVTFACAMTRAETFRELEGLDEALFPNSFGDVDICARALELGYRNYYFGGVSGVHHESKTRGFVTEDLEISALMERHAETFAAWRVRNGSRSYQHAWPMLVLPRENRTRPVPLLPPPPPPPLALPMPPAPEPAAEIPVSPGIPLRYRLADRAAATVKRGLGPAYRPLRVSIRKAGNVYKRIKTPRPKQPRPRQTAWHLAKRIVAPIPLLGPAGRRALRLARRLKPAFPKIRALGGDLRKNPEHALLYARAARRGGAAAVRDVMHAVLPSLRPYEPPLAAWFEQSRPGEVLLSKFRARRWPKRAPKFTVLTAVYNVKEDWLREAVESVIAQTYPHWELVLVNDGSPAPHIRPTLDELAARDPRIRVIHCPVNQGVSLATNLGMRAATGDYVAFMDHDDYLEPQALHRFAEAVLRGRPDLLYSDEAITGPDLGELIAIPARSSFSYDYYLNHPYFVHLIAVRTELLRRVGGLDESMTISQDVDLMLRLIEVCETIAHVPEVLYRWRTHPGSLGHQQMDRVQTLSREALERHLARIGVEAEVDDSKYFNFRDIRFRLKATARVAILVRAGGQVDPLRACLESLERTVPADLADVVVLAPSPVAPAMARYLGSLDTRPRVVAISDASTRSAFLNRGVEAVADGGYSHYLLLEDRAEAIAPGWLEHMLGFGQRLDVAIVGGTLISLQERIRHAGMFVGPDGSAIRSHENQVFMLTASLRYAGHNGILLASRDVTAVSASCLLIAADFFLALDGMEESLGAGSDDLDFCLRARGRGRKVIQDAQAVLYLHDEKAGEGETRASAATKAVGLLSRHAESLAGGDRFHSPLLKSYSPDIERNPLIEPRVRLEARIARVILPAPTMDAAKTRRRDVPTGQGPSEPSRASEAAPRLGSRPR